MCRDSLIGLPLCSVSSRATSSARSISRSPSLPHQPSALARRHLAPRPVERRARRRHRRVDVRRSADATCGDHLFGRRVDDLHRLARRGGAPFVVDEELLLIAASSSVRLRMLPASHVIQIDTGATRNGT